MACNGGDTVKVDAPSSGTTVLVLISGGTDLDFEENRADPSDSRCTQEGITEAFDDIPFCLLASELSAFTAWTKDM